MWFFSPKMGFGSLPAFFFFFSLTSFNFSFCSSRQSQPCNLFFFLYPLPPLFACQCFKFLFFVFSIFSLNQPQQKPICFFFFSFSSLFRFPDFFFFFFFCWNVLRIWISFFCLQFSCLIVRSLPNEWVHLYARLNLLFNRRNALSNFKRDNQVKKKKPKRKNDSHIKNPRNLQAILEKEKRTLG